MIIAIGEVVTDHFPEYQRIGGAPLNFACHLKKFGEDVGLITRLGTDAEGNDIRRLILDHNLPAELIQTDKEHATGRVNVTLDLQGVPHFDIVENAAYDFIDLNLSTIGERTSGTKLIYYGSLIQRSANGFSQIRRFLERRPSTAKCFCDINLRLPHVSRSVIEQCLRYADILKLNGDELRLIGEMLNVTGEASAVVRRLMTIYGLELVAVTLGEAGSFIVSEEKRYDAPIPEKSDMVDTVGAGDAFAAVLALGYLRHIPLNSVLEIATNFAARICACPGAIPDNDSPYKKVIRQLEGLQK
ncbi:MAG: hypothetical protein KKE00_01590 [Proteobacteria bacterium]|nr:hypothetical protein [Pseudomonadota bacterium]MBU1569206.1 hypothetical protein [Pseudomonadota bacterium]